VHPFLQLSLKIQDKITKGINTIQKIYMIKNKQIKVLIQYILKVILIQN